jgi:hypothetical protein
MSCPTTAVPQRQRVDVVGLIIIFVFDILQIFAECIQICRGYIAPTCNPPDYGPAHGPKDFRYAEIPVTSSS